jgi:hypothetical protein
MNSKLRKSDFKLGSIHGKIDPKEENSEAMIQRNVYLSQSIKIKRSNDDKKNSLIRLFAYEMPLGLGRDNCVDLVGYDVKHNLYLIELKKGSSTETLSKVIDQVNGYADTVDKIQTYIEKDFEKTFYLKLKFKEIRKLILAPREFYKGSKRNDYTDDTIEYLYFRDKDITERTIGKTINVHKVKF